ncbi:MAG: hypothetical protein FJY62_10530 [Betaproteobacteria bacterium]|nr:hypothetical protein [Betaproteobacteria bacterium]
MSNNESTSTQWIDHQKERDAVIAEYGSLWRQAIAKTGVVEEKGTEGLLQVCAACYLDGVHRGSALALEVIAKDGHK